MHDLYGICIVRCFTKYIIFFFLNRLCDRLHSFSVPKASYSGGGCMFALRISNTSLFLELKLTNTSANYHKCSSHQLGNVAKVYLQLNLNSFWHCQPLLVERTLQFKLIRAKETWLNFQHDNLKCVYGISSTSTRFHQGTTKHCKMNYLR